MKKLVLQIGCRFIATAFCLGAVGCDSSGIYKTVTPAYDLRANQDKKVLVWVEAPRSAGADVDASDVLAAAMRDHMAGPAKIKPSNIVLMGEAHGGTLSMQSPAAAALGAGAELSLYVRIEEYELIPLNIRNYHSGRLMTRAVLLDASTGQTLWPTVGQGKVHEVAIEMGVGERREVLVRMSSSMAHCILRNLYPIVKLHYKNSDERVSLQEAFELDTF